MHTCDKGIDLISIYAFFYWIVYCSNSVTCFPLFYFLFIIPG